MLRYNPGLTALARSLRRQSTLAEILLWPHLKGRQRRGVDFHRQKPVDEYIIDFFAPKLMLAVEIDGVSHRFKAAEDDERQRKLEALGVEFLRFEDRLVKRDLGAVVRTIDSWIEEWERTHPALRAPLSRGDSRMTVQVDVGVGRRTVPRNRR